MILQNEPKIKNTVEGISKNTWDLVHAGMQGVVTNNPGVFGKIISSDITLSGKTGTAQQSTTHPDHGLFVGFTSGNTGDKTPVALAIRIATDTVRPLQLKSAMVLWNTIMELQIRMN